jgi:hypothetical protein
MRIGRVLAWISRCVTLLAISPVRVERPRLPVTMQRLLLDVRIGQHEVAEDGDEVLIGGDEAAQGPRRGPVAVELGDGHPVGVVRGPEIREVAVELVDDAIGDRIVDPLCDLDIGRVQVFSRDRK